MPEILDKFREKMMEWAVDGVLITSPTNRRWLSGFTGSAGSLLITPEKAILSTDSRYWEQATEQAQDFAVFRHRNETEDTLAFFNLGEITRIGIEAKHMSVFELAELQKLEGFEWIPLETTCEELRAIKNPAEVTTIRAAARITDATIAQFPQLARPGITERQLAWELEKFMRESGAEKSAFDIIVASGPNSALPHHQPGSRPLAVGDVIVVDLGAQVDGYKSDLTRSFYLGEHPDDRFWQVYNTVAAAQAASLAGLYGGLDGKTADALARDIIVVAGYGDNFGHGTGHGVGLDIHEWPRLSRHSQTVILPAGSVVTVEPGIYLPNWGGVRLEDLVLLTADGAEVLSAAPKTPLIPV